MRNKCKGQSMVEYAVVISALITAVLVVPVRDNKNCIEVLLDVLRDNYRGYSYSMSAVQRYDIEEEDD